jgi:ankyrin repeat protein
MITSISITGSKYGETAFIHICKFLENEREVNMVKIAMLLWYYFKDTLDINYVDSSGSTALQWIANAECFDLFVTITDHFSNRLDINYVDDDGDTAFSIACYNNDKAIATAFMENYPKTLDLDIKNDDGETAYDETSCPKIKRAITFLKNWRQVRANEERSVLNCYFRELDELDYYASKLVR